LLAVRDDRGNLIIRWSTVGAVADVAAVASYEHA
jgi:hypothetical protein